MFVAHLKRLHFFVHSSWPSCLTQEFHSLQLSSEGTSDTVPIIRTHVLRFRLLAKLGTGFGNRLRHEIRNMSETLYVTTAIITFGVGYRPSRLSIVCEQRKRQQLPVLVQLVLRSCWYRSFGLNILRPNL